MKKWFCSRINQFEDTVVNVLDECESIEKDGYNVEQIVYVDGQYQIFIVEMQLRKNNEI